jgi:N-acyl-D-aspartate/D-glutamate deacylase
MLTSGFDVTQALKDPASRAKLKQASENGINGGFAWIKATGYSSMRITTSRERPVLVGKYLSELAAERKQDPFDLVSDLLTTGKDTIGITLGAIKEADVRLLLVQPWNMIASDGGYADSKSRPQGHPRSTGTFPRVLGHYVRDEKVLTLEDAVRKMTSLPADFVGLRDRGRVQEGQAADLAIFDPATVADKSTWDQPQLMATGIPHVLVNGVFVLRDGKLTGKTPGRYLRADH